MKRRRGTRVNHRNRKAAETKRKPGIGGIAAVAAPHLQASPREMPEILAEKNTIGP